MKLVNDQEISTNKPSSLTGIIKKLRDFQGHDIWLNIFLDIVDNH